MQGMSSVPTPGAVPSPRKTLGLASPGAPLPADELARLQTLTTYRLVETPPEAEYDELVALAADICQTPLSAISLLDTGRQWFKASVGLPMQETRRDVSFCSWAILEPTQTLVVPDATIDPRFRHNELVTGEPGLRSYAGIPLVMSDSQPVGALCVLDTRPRELSDRQLTALRTLANQVVAQFELRRALVEEATLTARLEHWEALATARRPPCAVE